MRVGTARGRMGRVTDAARAVLEDRLRGLVDQVHHADSVVGEEHPEGIHDLRVALRRVRSLLRTFEPLLGRAVVPTAAAVVDDCRWAGTTLGPARDTEVVNDVVAGLAELPERLRTHLAERAEADAAAARATVAALRRDPRYAALRDRLDALSADDVFTAADERTAVRCVRRAWTRLDRRATAADDEPAGSLMAGLALHETRKAAKRARYAVEAAAPLLDEASRSRAALAEQVQDALGLHRDARLAVTLVDELAVGLSERTDVQPLLDALQERAAEALAAYTTLRPHLRDPGVLASGGVRAQAP